MPWIGVKYETIIFVCHGSILRSPAAGFIAMQIKNLLIAIKNLILSLEQRLTKKLVWYLSSDEKGIKKRNINIEFSSATRISQAEYEVADFIFYMDAENFVSLKHQLRLTKNNTFPINKWTPSIYDIEDPWYTGRFALVCEQITMCIHDIFEHIWFCVVSHIKKPRAELNPI